MFSFWEKILLEQIRRGNPRAFAKLYDFYAEKIQRFIFFKVSRQEVAEELTNSVFTKILNYLLEGSEIKNFRAFLYQTARNLVIDFYRSRREEISLEEVSERDFEENKDLGKGIDIKLDLGKIEKALRKIPDRYREVLILRFIEELSFKEIAKIIDQKEATVRMSVHRGIKELREQLTTNDKRQTTNN